MKIRVSRFVIAVVLSIPVTSLVCAQDGQSVLSGAIKDPAGAGIPNVKISVKNIASGQTMETTTTPAGFYSLSNLAPGEYEVSAGLEGFNTKTATVTLVAGAPQMLDMVLMATGSSGGLSLGDLGFSPQQSQGSAAAQALLNRRSHMLQIHQKLGLITAAPLVATLISSGDVGERHGSSTGRNVHMALGIATAGLYFTTASYAIRAPKVPGTTTRGQIRLHKTLAWIHGTGMIVTPILGMLAYRQISRGERVHGIAKAHPVAAWTTAVAYGAAIVSVSFKF